MGAVLSSFWSLFSGYKEFKVCMVGLDNAGKTSILYRLHLGESVSTYPTIGSNVEELIYKKVRLCVWDLGGQQDLREMWRLYYLESAALIMVIDSADDERLDVAKDELHQALKSEELHDAAVLVYANKQDLKSALSASEISDALALYNLKTQPWHIQACSAIRGDGLQEGIQWLADCLQQRQQKL